MKGQKKAVNGRQKAGQRKAVKGQGKVAKGPGKAVRGQGKVRARSERSTKGSERSLVMHAAITVEPARRPPRLPCQGERAAPPGRPRRSDTPAIRPVICFNTDATGAHWIGTGNRPNNCSGGNDAQVQCKHPPALQAQLSSVQVQSLSSRQGRIMWPRRRQTCSRGCT